MLAELAAEEPTAEKPIQRSEAHKPGEKRKLAWISIGLTAFWILALLWRLPRPSDQYARLREGIESQIRLLAGLAERYRNGTLRRDAAQRGTDDVPAHLPP